MTATREPNENRSSEVSSSVPVLEEVAVVTKRRVSTGKVRISTHADRVDDIARCALQAESVEVTRVPIDTIVERAPEVRTEGDTTIIPIMEEMLVVEKKLVLKEELHVRRRVETETVEVPVTLHRQHAVIEHIDEAGQPTQDKETS